MDNKRLGLNAVWGGAMLAIIFVGSIGPLTNYVIGRYYERIYHTDNFMQVTSVSVGNAVAGERVEMKVDRAIIAPFLGTYHVTVRAFPSGETVCSASDTVQYKVGADFPEPITLAWWADDGACSGSDLAPGDYTLDTTWVIHNDEPRLANQRIFEPSNPFTISAVSAEEATDTVNKTRGLVIQVEDLENMVQQLQQEIDK
jgi:hypothetical protein